MALRSIEESGDRKFYKHVHGFKVKSTVTVSPIDGHAGEVGESPFFAILCVADFAGIDAAVV